MTIIFNRPVNSPAFDRLLARNERSGSQFHESVDPSQWGDSDVAKAVCLMHDQEGVRALCLASRTSNPAGKTHQHRIQYTDIYWTKAISNSRLFSLWPRPPENSGHFTEIGCLTSDASASLIHGLSAVPELAPILTQLLLAINRDLRKIELYSDEAKDSLQAQRDSLAIVLRMAGVNPNIMNRWTPPDVEKDGSVNYLAGLVAQARAASDESAQGVGRPHRDEDEVIESDSRHWHIKLPHGATVLNLRPRIYTFVGKDNVVTVANVNRRDAETELGVDLVVRDERYKRIAMLQYKMYKKGRRAYYPSGDTKFQTQLAKMLKWQSRLMGKAAAEPDEYRLSNSVYFFKFCTPLTLEKFDPSELADGMILPVELVDLYYRNGTKGFGPDGIKRHLTNTQFKELHSSGWIGTSPHAFDAIWEIVMQSLSSDIMVADIQEKPKRSKRKPPKR